MNNNTLPKAIRQQQQRQQKRQNRDLCYGQSKTLDKENQYFLKAEENELIRGLISQMGKDHMEPSNGVIVDGDTHCYKAYDNGKYKKACYTASLDTFGKKKLILICHYWYQGKGPSWSYSSAVTPKKCNHL